MTRRAVLRPDDSEVPPEPGAISEQPELSHVHRMQAEMEMHKAAARRGVAFASQSERLSESARNESRAPTQTSSGRRQQQSANSHRRRRDRVPLQSFGSHSASLSERERSTANDDGSATPSASDDYYDEDTEEEDGRDTTPLRDSSAHRHRKQSRSVSFGASTMRAARSPPKAQQSPLTSARNGLAETQQQQEQQTVQHRQKEAPNGKKADKPATVAPKSFWGKVKQFFSRNVMLIVAMVVMLVLVGVGVFMLFRGNREKDKREREQVASQALLDEEQVQHERDYALEELREQNARLQSEQTRFAEMMQAYEQQNEQFRMQNEAQMEAMEQLVDQNEQYAAALTQWQEYASEQERLAAARTSVNDSQQHIQQTGQSALQESNNHSDGVDERSFSEHWPQQQTARAETGPAQYMSAVAERDDGSDGPTIFTPLVNGDAGSMIYDVVGDERTAVMSLEESAAAFGQLKLSKTQRNELAQEEQCSARESDNNTDENEQQDAQ